MAIIGLWAGPWLRDVAGLDRATLATCLLVTNLAMGIGFLSWGLLTERLARLGMRPMTVAGIGMGTFVVILVIMATGRVTGPGVWILLAAVGFFASAGSLNYAIVSQHFPRDLAGRANTALNVLVFLTAFVAQWGIGGILRFWEDPVTHQYGATGYQVAFVVVAVLQLTALAWFLRQWWRRADMQGPEQPVPTEARPFDVEAPAESIPTDSARKRH
jgi:hypothetical protein